MSTVCNENVGSYRTVRKRVSSLKPSPENTRLYKAIDPGDHEVIRLTDSITLHGLREPLIVTADNYVVSGHRRLCALQFIGQRFAPCRVLKQKCADMTTDEYIALLRDCNRQRSKSVAEQVREELVDIDPEQAARNLRIRRETSRDSYRYSEDVTTLNIEGRSHRWGISDQKSEHVEHIRKVVFKDRRGYWPLSVCAVHYALLNYQFLRNTKQELPYLNNQHSYQATSNLLTRMRLNCSIPWEAIRDETRPVQEFRAFSDVRRFIRQECSGLFVGYWRDLLQTQPNYVECLVEKNTVYHMAMRATEKYQIPTCSGRGFSSADLWHEIAQCFRTSGKEKLILIVLVAWASPPSLAFSNTYSWKSTFDTTESGGAGWSLGNDFRVRSDSFFGNDPWGDSGGGDQALHLAVSISAVPEVSSLIGMGLVGFMMCGAVAWKRFLSR